MAFRAELSTITSACPVRRIEIVRVVTELRIE
jgi:hypothetical protein